MKKITDEMIHHLNISSQSKIDWVNESLTNKDNTILNAKTSLKDPKFPGRFYNFMPAILPYLNIAGMKIVNRYPGRSPTLNSEIFVYNYSDGYLSHILDGDYITTMRTGASAVHSISLLIRKYFVEHFYIFNKAMDLKTTKKDNVWT